MNGLMRSGCAYSALLCLMALAGCGSTPLNRAPVEDRSPSSKAATESLPLAKPAAGLENAGKSGYYTVKPGDTLIKIGLESGQSYKDLARWNALENPNRIEVGQVLRVVPPVAAETSSAVVAKPIASSSATTTPIAPVSGATAASVVPATSAVVAAASAPSAGTGSKPSSAAVTSAAAPTGSAAADDDMGWIWPAKGPVLAEFDEVKNKGLDLGGAAGDTVVAAADGKVVYAGEGLRGYGKLIIIKHNTTYLTAYAHNQSLMVKEDQSVKRGQKIAEMGNTDADRVKLHFEVRRLGKPVDPAKYMPTR